MAIVVSAAGLSIEKLNSVLDLSAGLAPLYGDTAQYLIGIGLFGAGITSAVTAPLAASYVASSCFNWQVGPKDWKFRAVWIFVMGVGLLSLGSSYSPIIVIQFAQIANGILLPILVITLIWICNSKTLLGVFKNTLTQNILYGIIFVFTLGLSIRTLAKLIGI
jgi:Mn2+/Fe2+ NRAMP family transporter